LTGGAGIAVKLIVSGESRSDGTSWGELKWCYRYPRTEELPGKLGFRKTKGGQLIKLEDHRKEKSEISKQRHRSKAGHL